RGAAGAESMVDDDGVVAVTLTGNEQAGRSVASRAAKRMKKSVLELGGSDPFVVTGRADVAMAASVAVSARTINNGQSCIAAKRFILEEPIASEFERAMV